MTTAIRMRAERLLAHDRSSRAAPRAAAETYPLTSGTRGSTLYGWLAGAGAGVSEASAMRIGAVYASVGLIGGAIAALPYHIYERSRDGERTRVEDDLWWLFNESPSPRWTAASAWQFAGQSILLKGDSFWEVIRASRYSSRIIGFEPHHPDATHVKQVGGRNLYTIYADVGEGRIERRVRDQDDVLHFAGLGFNGLRSITPIRAALGASVSLAAAADEHTTAFFKGGARPDHAIVVPPTMKVDQPQRDLIKETWAGQRQHYAETGMPPVLVGGMDIKALTINAEDAQLLETRQQTVEDIARIFGVPPHMIGKTDASTSWGSGIEQMSMGFVRYTLMRHLDVIRQEINRKCFSRGQGRFGEHAVKALLEGDTKAQSEFMAKALGGPGSQGYMSVNEARRLQNLPKINEPWADVPQRAGSKPLAKEPNEKTEDDADA